MLCYLEAGRSGGEYSYQDCSAASQLWDCIAKAIPLSVPGRSSGFNHRRYEPKFLFLNQCIKTQQQQLARRMLSTCHG